MKRRTIAFVCLLALMLGCNGVRTEGLSVGKADPIAADHTVSVEKTITDGKPCYVINGERYCALEEQTPDTDFTEYYGWRADLSCFEPYASVTQDETFYRSPSDENTDVLVLVNHQGEETLASAFAREDAKIHDWKHYSDSFFQTALVNRTICKTETVRPLIEAHFHGEKNAATLDSDEVWNVYEDSCNSRISLEVKDIPGLWYTFNVIGKESITVYSRMTETHLDLHIPLTQLYGVLLEERCDSVSTMIRQATRFAETKESGYSVNGVPVRKGPLRYHNSLLIPLESTLSELPYMINGGDEDVIRFSVNADAKGNLSGVTSYAMDLQSGRMTEKETGFSYDLREIVGDTYTLEQQDDDWWIDIESFEFILNQLWYTYFLEIDTNEGIFQLQIKQGEYDHRSWDLRSFESGVSGGADRWPIDTLY